jgi:membrane protein DedA with SNARE-associated domain
MIRSRMFPRLQTDLDGLAGFVVDVVDALGPVGVGALVALENLFPPIPSEVVLPVAGYLAGRGEMSLVLAIVAATVGSLVGAVILYAAGALVGLDRLYRWFDRVPLLAVSDVERTERWFARYGGWAVLIGRCVPVVRSLISIPAGITRMPMGRFLLYTAIGSGVWNTVFITAGYALGAQWEDVGRYSDPINYTVYAAIAATFVVFVVRRLRTRPA